MIRARIELWLVLAALAGGCAGVAPTATQPAVPRQDGPRQDGPQPDGAQPRNPDPAPHNLSGFSPAFRQGYAAGCRSSESGARRRDDSRYQVDADYTMGWNDGHSACARRK